MFDSGWNWIFLHILLKLKISTLLCWKFWTYLKHYSLILILFYLWTYHLLNLFLAFLFFGLLFVIFLFVALLIVCLSSSCLFFATFSDFLFNVPFLSFLSESLWLFLLELFFSQMIDLIWLLRPRLLIWLTFYFYFYFYFCMID